MNVGRYVDNRTPMVVRAARMDDQHGREQLVTVAKLTWAVTPTGVVTLLQPPAPLRFVAETRDGPGTSVRYPDNLVQFKPGTDVVLIGTARPPAGAAVTSMDVTLQVGDGTTLRIDKTVRVHGKRVWQKALTGVAPGPAQPVGPTPLIYESTYGGRDESRADKPLVEPRNPLGLGLVRDSATLVGQPTPALEDVRHPLSSRRPAPACFAPIPSHWEPLAQHAGTHDQAWVRQRAPIRPLDFNPRYDCCAPDDQHCDPALIGDEMFAINGVIPGRPWRFQLPRYRPTFVARRRDEDQDRVLDTHLDTVLIDADDQVVELTWRASVPLPAVPQLLAWVRVGSTDTLPAAIHADIVAAGRAQLEPTS